MPTSPSSVSIFSVTKLRPGQQTIVLAAVIFMNQKLSSNDAIFDATRQGVRMRTTINIDEELLAKATKLAGPLDRSAVVREGLKALIERETARRLARLGGSQPKLEAAPRRRGDVKS